MNTNEEVETCPIENIPIKARSDAGDLILSVYTDINPETSHEIDADNVEEIAEVYRCHTFYAEETEDPVLYMEQLDKRTPNYGGQLRNYQFHKVPGRRGPDIRPPGTISLPINTVPKVRPQYRPPINQSPYEELRPTYVQKSWNNCGPQDVRRLRQPDQPAFLHGQRICVQYLRAGEYKTCAVSCFF